MSLTPSLGAAQACLLGTGENNADLCVFKLDALVLECLKDCDTHIATGEVIVCAVNNSLFVPHPIKTNKERNKDKTEQSGFDNPSVADCNSGIESNAAQTVVCHIND